jgi:hypothetical protein
VGLNARSGEGDGCTAYDCAGPDDNYRTVWYRAGHHAEGTRTVEATLRLRYVPPGLSFPGFWEHRLMGAVRK